MGIRAWFRRLFRRELQPEFWSNEDGDEWLGYGHHDRDVAIEAIRRCEIACCDEISEELSDALECGDVVVRHVWVVEHDDGEVLCFVGKETPGAEPATRVWV